MNAPRRRSFMTIQSETSKRVYAGAAALMGAFVLTIQLYLIISIRFSTGINSPCIGGMASFLSFFTVDTNILVTVALAAAAIAGSSGIVRFFASPPVNATLAASIAIVGIGYSLLLRNLWNPTGLQFLADVVMHDVMPIVFLIYWWIWAAKKDLRWTDVPLFCAYPLIYLAYAMLRGALSGIYPYPFIDVGQLGYARVCTNLMGCAAAFVVVSIAVVAVARWKQRTR